MKKLLLLLLFVSTAFFVWGQTEFNLSFENPTFTPAQDSLSIEVKMSFDTPGKLGSSNLVFSYDTSALALSSFEQSVSSPFYSFGLTRPQAGKGSYNISLFVPGFGETVPPSPQEFDLVTLHWEVKDLNGDLSINWLEDGTKATVVFLDDESTRLASDSLTSYMGIGGTFPVEWETFTATQWGNRAKLNWATAQELNNQGFWVERSIDASIFERIGFQPSQGNSDANQAYEWIDHEAASIGLEAPIYYRLTQVDLDGTTSQSEIRSLRFDLGEVSLVNVHPNNLSLGESLRVEMILPDDNQVNLELHNAAGQVVASETLEIQTGALATYEFPINSIPTGIYYFMVAGQDEIHHATRIQVR